MQAKIGEKNLFTSIPIRSQSIYIYPFFKARCLKLCTIYERSYLHVYIIHEQVIILIKLYIEPPEYLHVHVLYIQVTQINTSTTLCSSRKRIKYLCIFRYLNSGLTTCTESSYWKFKKWVHVIYHKQSSISKDVEGMLRVHGREGFGGEGGGGDENIFALPSYNMFKAMFL